MEGGFGLSTNSGKLTKQERCFCSSFVECGNTKEAAKASGYLENPKKAGEELLGNPKILREISHIAGLRKEILGNMAYTGYLRLAFGGVSDAVRLLFADSPTDEQIADMDLFSVAEIKKHKDGSMEFKFADRLKALEKLEMALPNNDDRAVPFYEALRQASRSIGQGQGFESNEV